VPSVALLYRGSKQTYGLIPSEVSKSIALFYKSGIWDDTDEHKVTYTHVTHTHKAGKQSY